MHFEKIEHFNSSTITALIKLIQICRKSNVKLVMVYDQSSSGSGSRSMRCACSRRTTICST